MLSILHELLGRHQRQMTPSPQRRCGTVVDTAAIGVGVHVWLNISSNADADSGRRRRGADRNLWTGTRAPADVTDRAATRVLMSSLELNARILRVAGLWPDLSSRLSTAYSALAAAFQVRPRLLPTFSTVVSPSYLCKLVSLLVTQGLALVWGRAGLAAVSLNVCVMTTIAAGICKAAAFLWQAEHMASCRLPPPVPPPMGHVVQREQFSEWQPESESDLVVCTQLATARQLTACLQGCQHSAEADVAALGVTRYYVGVGGAAVVVWNLMPLLLESDRSLPTIAWYPYDETETPFFELTYVLQGISTFYCCITNVGLNVFLVSLIIYVSDELKNLNDSISSINYSTSHNCNCSYGKQHGLLYRSSKIVADDGERDIDTYKSHSKNLRQRTQFCCVVKAQQYLWMCLQYHQELIKTVKKLETTMTGVVFIEFVAGIIVTCLTLFHAAVNAGNMALFLKFVMYLLYMTVGMFIYCWYGQDLMEKSEDLKWAAYSCNWQGAPRSFTDLLKIVMLWAQQPLILSAGKYYRISLKTFVTLLNASYSYYAVLRQINDTEK
ncbi:uncharacterized protein LOC126335971 [Schistocerca gregaria]|nr:uncharacterized protein LOC126335971 [Schistocerca gregaria]